MKLIRTTSDHPDFGQLVAELDAYLRVLDGDDHEFYAQFNKSSLLKKSFSWEGSTIAWFWEK